MPSQTPGYNTPTASTSTGSGGGAGTGTANGSANYEGWAKQFESPQQLQNIYSNPWTLLPYVFKGMNPYGVGYSGLRNLNFDPLTMFTMMNGGQSAGSFAQANEGDYANFLNNLYRMVGGVNGTPGRGFSAQELSGNVFGAQKGTALGELLTAGDTSQQQRTLYNLLRDVAGASMNPLASRAYESMAQRAIDMAGSQLLGSTAGDATQNKTMAQLVASIAPQLMAR